MNTTTKEKIKFSKAFWVANTPISSFINENIFKH